MEYLWESNTRDDEDFKTERILFKENEYEPHVYLIRIIDQDKYYVGCRTAMNCLRTDLGDCYFTSSKIVKPIWLEHPDNIEILDIQLCASNHDAQILESEFILEYALKDESFLNIGYAGCKFNPSGVVRSEETRKKISAARLGKDPWNKNKKGLQSHTEEHKQWLRENSSGENNPFYGRTHSEETKRIIGEKSRGRVHSEETKLIIGESSKGRLPWNTGQETPQEIRDKISQANMGKKRTEETKQKLSKAAKNRKRLTCPHCNKEIPVNVYPRFHGENCKYKQEET